MRRIAQQTDFGESSSKFHRHQKALCTTWWKKVGDGTGGIRWEMAQEENEKPELVTVATKVSKGSAEVSYRVNRVN